MREIPLKGGGVALVDDRMFDLLDRYDWRRAPMGSPVTNDGGQTISMSRLVKSARRCDPKIVFLNGNRNDCRLANLRYRKGGDAEAMR